MKESTGAAELRPWLLRELTVPPQVHPRDQPHLSAASGLVCAHGRVYVVADDELHLGVFHDSKSPGELLRLAEGQLPEDKSARKKRKPDLETLLLMPGGGGGAAGSSGTDATDEGAALLALGSGSTPRRERAMWMPLDGEGALQPARLRQLDLAPWYAPLRALLGEINIEGALWLNDEFVLLQRGGDGSRGTNATLHFARHEVLAWLADAVASTQAQTPHTAPRLRELRPYDLGRVQGVALGFTDAAALPARVGGGFLFTAVAEASGDSVADGACAGSVLGRIDARGQIAWMRPLGGAPKVEGIDVCTDADAARAAGGVASPAGLELCLVTDADDPARASQLLRLSGVVA